MFKVSNRNTRTRSEICSKLTIKTPEQRHWRRSGVFIVNFEHISHLALLFLLLTLSRQMPAGVCKKIRFCHCWLTITCYSLVPLSFSFPRILRNFTFLKYILNLLRRYLVEICPLLSVLKEAID